MEDCLCLTEAVLEVCRGGLLECSSGSFLFQRFSVSQARAVVCDPLIRLNAGRHYAGNTHGSWCPVVIFHRVRAKSVEYSREKPCRA